MLTQSRVVGRQHTGPKVAQFGFGAVLPTRHVLDAPDNTVPPTSDTTDRH